METALSLVDADMKIFVHPSCARNPVEAVHRQLSSLLFTYVNRFEGVLLAHDTTFPSKNAQILPGLIPHCQVEVKAKLLLFSPKPGMILEGKVIRVGKGTIQAKVLGCFSVTIVSEYIRKEFKFKKKDGVEAYISSSHKHHKIRDGTMIRFLVNSVDKEILYMTGSLIPPHTGCIRWLFKHNIEGEKHDQRPEKRNREDEVNAAHIEQESGALDNDNTLLTSKTKKSKRKIALE